jgi:pimeloyl-ACP methyl ester carboxylesterase
MLQPPGFNQHSVSTSLGTMVYYKAGTADWQVQNAPNQPSLVFLHGFGGGSSAYEWSKVYPAFAANYHVIAPDLLGWGRSEHLTRPYRVDDYLISIAEFLQKVCQPPAIVVASSLTAALTVRVAVAYPNLFRALVLMAPAGLSDFGRPYNSVFSQLVSLPVLDRVIYSTGIANSIGIRSFLEQRQFAHANRVSQEMVDAYLSSAQQSNAEYSALSFVRGDLCFDLAEYMPHLTTPTAILWGKKAQFTGYQLGEQLAELNRSAIKALYLIDDVGLTPQLELPAVTIGLIRKFLESQGM